MRELREDLQDYKPLENKAFFGGGGGVACSWRVFI